MTCIDCDATTQISDICMNCYYNYRRKCHFLLEENKRLQEKLKKSTNKHCDKSIVNCNCSHCFMWTYELRKILGDKL